MIKADNTELKIDKKYVDKTHSECKHISHPEEKQGDGLIILEEYTIDIPECGIKSNGIDYSHRVCVWPSGKEKKRNVSLWTPYMRVAVICIWGEEAIKRSNWRGRHVILKAKSRHWVKRSWRELWSHVTLKVGASSIVGMKEFRPLF